MTDVNANNIPDEPEEEVTQECSWCCETYPEDDMSHMEIRLFTSRANNMVWLCEACQDNAFYCTSCSRLHHTEDSHEYNDSWCHDCYTDYYATCDDCGDEYVIEDGCSYCDRQHRLIHDYSYRPDPQFFIGGAAEYTHRVPNGMSVTGFELEMEASSCDVDEGAELANELYQKWCYLKYDGSLNNGFEMVSHPLSYKYMMDVFPFDSLKQLSDLGMRSSMTRTCGLHVHINKSFFSSHPTTMWRFMSMFYRNPDKWKRVAGRENSNYANWSEYELEQMLNYTKGLKEGRRVSNSDRYVALNLQNSQTIELRFFKGTLSPTALRARLEAVHAVAHYCDATKFSVPIKASHDWERFREWTVANKYNAFDQYATTKGV